MDDRKNNMNLCIMNKPKMILFDYGQTLVSQKKFDGVKGTEAVLQYAIENKYHKTAEEIQNVANDINRECVRFDPEKTSEVLVEIPSAMFSRYLYTSQGIKLSIGSEDIDRIFWDAAAPGEATEGIQDFLSFLEKENIRTGVISNISFCGKVVEERIYSCIPDHTFDFIIASSEYMYRKPHRRIFDLALEMAGLSPEEVWFVGDDYECDIVGARNAGMFPVYYIGALDLPLREDDSVMKIKHWEELKEVLSMYELQETIRPSADLRNHYNELLEILAEADEDVKYGRVAPVKDTFDDLRSLLKGDNS